MPLSSWLRGALPAVLLGLLSACSGAGAAPSSGTEPVVTVAPTTTSPPIQEMAHTNPPPVVEYRVSYDVGPNPAGWTKFGPTGDTLLQLSGPPGGPLGLSVTRVRALADEAALSAWIKADFKRNMNRDVDPGKPTKVTLGGAEVLAYSFTTGESLARSAYCIALYPLAKPSAWSVVVSADVGAGPTQAASCASVIASPSIAPVWNSLKVTPE